MKPLFSFVKEERGFSHPHFCRRILERKGKTGVFVAHSESFRACWMWFFTGIAVEHASLVFCGCDFGLEVNLWEKSWFSMQSCRIPKQVPDHHDLNRQVKKTYFTHSFFPPNFVGSNDDFSFDMLGISLVSLGCKCKDSTSPNKNQLGETRSSFFR